MAQLRIYQPARTAMQSGRGNTRQWRLEFAPGAAKDIDPLMGWTGSPDTDGQIAIAFDTKEEAIAFATRTGLGYTVQDPQQRQIRPKAYADNFRFDRVR